MFKRGGILSPRLKLVVAIVGITLSLVLLAQTFGLLPNETKSQVEARARIAEALAIQLANAASRKDTELVEMTIASVVARNDDVLSIGIREISGRVVVGSGDHSKYWPKADFKAKSTPSHVRVPLFREKRNWGQIEIAFRPLSATERYFGLPQKILYLLAFLAITGLLAVDFLLRRTLRELDPNQVVPGRVQTAFDTMAEGVLIVDHNETVVLVNQAFIELTGIAKARLFGKELSKLNWLSDGKALRDGDLPWQIATRTGEAQTNVSLSLHLGDNERFQFVANSTPVNDQQGAVQGAIVTFDDVTLLERKNEELKTAVGELQELSSELEERVTERTRAAEEAAHEAVEANARLQTEVIERSRAEEAVAEQRDSLVRQQMALSGLTARMQIAGPDWLNSIRQLSETSGRLLGAGRVSIWLDIEHKGTFHCIDTYETAANTHVTGGVLESSADPVFYGELEEGRTVVADESAEDPRTQVLHSLLLSQHETISLLALPILRDGVLEGILMLENQSSGRKWKADHQVFATAIANMASLILEARERQRVEDNLRQSNSDLVAATEAKSQFLANMSHELRTPMNGVFGMTDLLLRTSLTERQNKLVSTISHSAKSLLVIINDILDLSKIENGRMELEVHDFRLNECVEDVADLLAEQAHKKGLNFNLYIDAGVIGSFMGDSGRLRQVLLNLVGNAIKFTDKGEVCVSVREMVPAEGETVGAIRFEILDTGIGIASEVQDQLFKPFSQADSSISRRFGGTGLGLSISQHLVSLMGGQIDLESELGAGTRIWFDLALPATVYGQTEDLHLPAVPSGRRVLVVDADATVREIASNYLGSFAVEVVGVATLEDGQAELECAPLDGMPFDLVLLDFELDRAGNYALSRFSASVRGQKAPALVWLASVMSDAETDLAGVHAAAVVVNKPLRRQAFIEAIGKQLQPDTAEQAATRGSVGEKTDGLGLNVLVAEDNSINQFVAMEYLDEIGCTYVIVDNGIQAVEKMRSSDFDIVLMDCQMPEMDGLTAARQITDERYAAGRPVPPIIALTGNTSDDDLDACDRAGMVDHVGKPYSSAALRNILEKWRPVEQVAEDPGGEDDETLSGESTAA